jgi:zinc protease
MLPGERIIDVESTQNLTNSRQTNTKASFTPEAAYRPVNDSDDKPLLMQAKRPQFKAIELNRHIPFPVAKRFRLSTGLPVVVIERPNLPIVHARLVVKAGSDVSSPENPDLPRLTADMVTEGTTTKSALDISDAAQDISARLSPGGNSESSGVALDTLSRNLVPALELLADVVTNPTFPVKEFDILRRQELQAFRRKRSDNQSVAYHTLMPLLYGKQHPYGVSLAQSRLSLESMRSEDLRRFYSTYWRPNNATLFVVGDVKSVELQPQLERYFANWRAAPVPPTPAPALPVKSPVASQRTPIYVIDRPGASQSYICVGAVGVERASLDFMPLEVANMILGGNPGSRLAQRLRTDKGYTLLCRQRLLCAARRRTFHRFNARSGRCHSHVSGEHAGSNARAAGLIQHLGL